MSQASSNPSSTLVVNVTKSEFDFYIGRNPQRIKCPPHKDMSRFSNPHVIGEYGDRDKCVDDYEIHLRKLLAERPHLKEDLRRMKGHRIGCWCAPKRCHGDVIVKLLGEL